MVPVWNDVCQVRIGEKIMTNSSPTITEKIVMSARRQVYADARRLGVSPLFATHEANEVAAFIHQIAESIPQRQFPRWMVRQWIREVL